MPTPRRISVSRELWTIGRSLESIVGALGALGPALKAIEEGSRESPWRAGPGASRRRSGSPPSSSGRYMGYMRNLGPRQKARVKALRAAQGIDAAIRLAKQLAG